MRTLTVLADGLVFPEGPRWHDGRLWFSDMHAHTVRSLDLAGGLKSEFEVASKPSGLGWLPDGTLLVVSMEDRKLLRRAGGGLAVHADLAALAPFHCNDMVVDGRGNAYVGNFGFDLFAPGAKPVTTCLVLVTPEGRARLVAEEIFFPNGTAVTPDGRTLIIAETFAARLSAFAIAEDGSLADRRVFAELPQGAVPDGICLDAEGAVWVASPTSGEALRILEGGRIAERIKVATEAYACALGGPDRRTLFLCTAPKGPPAEKVRLRQGRIEVTQVEVPGAGWP